MSNKINKLKLNKRKKLNVFVERKNLFRFLFSSNFIVKIFTIPKNIRLLRMPF